MKIICNSCGARYSVSDEKLKDKSKVYKVTCRKCSNKIVISQQEDEELQLDLAHISSGLGGNTGGGEPNEFDQVATKVFDYEQYTETLANDATNQSAGVVDSGGAGEVISHETAWYVVKDGEQVGPVSSEQMAQEYAAGRVNENSYVWKEGFSDWKHLMQIEQLYQFCLSAVSGGAASSAPAGAPSSAAYSHIFDDDKDEDNDPTQVVKMDVGLFDGGGASGSLHSVSSGDVVMSQPDSDPQEGLQSSSSSRSPRQRTFIGERNENSVLFSLDNLKQMAESQQSAPAVASTAAPAAGDFSVTQDSGLIDIRSISLGKPAKESTGGGDAFSDVMNAPDDVIAFRPGGVSGPAIGTPLASTLDNRSSNRGLILGIASGVAVSLVLGIIASYYFLIYLPSKRTNDKPVVRKENPPTVKKDPTLPKQPKVMVQPKQPKVVPPPTLSKNTVPNVQPKDPVTPKPTVKDPGVKDPGVKDPGVKDPGTKDPDDDPDKDKKVKKRKKDRKKDRKHTRRDRDKRPKEKKKKDPVEPKTDVVKKKKNVDVNALLQPTGPTKTKKTTSPGNENLPKRLSAPSVMRVVNRYHGRIHGCFNRSASKGKGRLVIRARVTIAPSGSVKAVRVKNPGGDGGLTACVRGALSGMKFPRFSGEAMSITLPFVLQ